MLLAAPVVTAAAAAQRLYRSSLQYRDTASKACLKQHQALLQQQAQRQQVQQQSQLQSQQRQIALHPSRLR
jgi:hypothetical protein